MDLFLVRMFSNSRKASHILLNYKKMFLIESEEDSLIVKKDNHIIYHSNWNIWGNKKELVYYIYSRWGKSRFIVVNMGNRVYSYILVLLFNYVLFFHTKREIDLQIKCYGIHIIICFRIIHFGGEGTHKIRSAKMGLEGGIKLYYTVFMFENPFSNMKRTKTKVSIK